MAVINIIDKEEALRIDSIAEPVRLLKQKVEELNAVILDLDAKSKTGGGFRRFMEISWSVYDEKNRMDTMKSRINDSKSTLILALQQAQVGIVRSIGDRVNVNADTVYRVQKLLEECLEVRKGLRITELLRARGERVDSGIWQLREEDLTLLVEQAPPYPQERQLIERLFDGNKVTSGSILFTDVGKDGGDDYSVAHVDRVEARNNEVNDRSLFAAGPTSFHNISRLMTLHRRLNEPAAAPTSPPNRSDAALPAISNSGDQFIAGRAVPLPRERQ